MTASAVAVGTFDGVHLGHKAVLDEVLRQAHENGLQPLAITFDRHPLSLIDPSRVPPMLTDTERKTALLRKSGVNPVVVPFDTALRQTTAREWMERLAAQWGVKVLVVGYDTTFGCDGLDLALADYARLGEEFGIKVVEAPRIEGISSSAIRRAVSAGNVDKAARMLGRPFTLTGHVVAGNQLGRTIGFPTANIEPQPGTALPAHGVYIATATLPDGSQKKAVVNVGVRPTVRRGNKPTIEAHVIDWSGDLYGWPLTLAFHKKIRPEIQFNSIDALRDRIEKDVAEARLFPIPRTNQAKAGKS